MQALAQKYVGRNRSQHRAVSTELLGSVFSLSIFSPRTSLPRAYESGETLSGRWFLVGRGFIPGANVVILVTSKGCVRTYPFEDESRRDGLEMKFSHTLYEIYGTAEAVSFVEWA
jgi:hypothetical protein